LRRAGLQRQSPAREPGQRRRRRLLDLDMAQFGTQSGWQPGTVLRRRVVAVATCDSYWRQLIALASDGAGRPRCVDCLDRGGVANEAMALGMSLVVPCQVTFLEARALTWNEEL